MVHRIIRLLAIATVAALVALILAKGSFQTDAKAWWLAPMLFALWIVGPTVTAYGFSRLYRHRPWFPPVMLGFLATSAIFSTFAYYQAFFVSKSSTAALVMIMVPIFQWAALVVLAFASTVAAIWLDRRADRE